ncbi:MAG: rod shape-determining protein MreD [Clostridium sp.]|nr:rod shape-determining protein MreD [Clostridium sp.]
MTPRDILHKWLIYALGLVPIWMLDAFILNRYPVWGVAPTLLPLAVTAVAVLEGANGGGGFGLGVALFWVMCYPTGDSWLILLLTLTGMAIGGISQYALSKSYPSFLLCSVCTLILLDAPKILHRFLFRSVALPDMLHLATRECLLSLLWSPVVYLIFRLVYRKVGGSKLA